MARAPQFSPGVIDHDGRKSAGYRAGRALSAEAAGTWCARRVRTDSILLMLLVLFFPGSASAQGITHGFVSVGAGATDLDAGLDWVAAGGPIGIGGEVGAGWVFLAAITGSYHFLAARPGRHDVFATVGYAGLESSELSAQGVTAGGGATYWLATRVGVRFDAFRFLPVSTEHNIPVEDRSATRYWGVRAGVAFRFR